MRKIVTTDKPIRYVGNDNNGVWVENLTEQGLVTVCVLYLPIVNEYYQHITDGLYIEIERFPKGDYLFDGYYVEPERGRKQKRDTLRGKSYDEALTASRDWLCKMLEEHRVTIERYYPGMYEDEGQLEMNLSGWGAIA